MVAYISILIVLFLLSFIEVFSKNKKIVLLSILLLIFLGGLRFQVGYDFGSYENFFSAVHSISDVFSGKIDAEVGYLFLNYLFNRMNLSFTAFLFFYCGLSIGLLGNFLYRYTPYPTTILTYYYCRFFLVRDMGQIRASLAAIICLYAIPYIMKRDTLKVFLIVFIAALFHTVSWFMLVAYFTIVVIGKLNFKKIVLLFLLCIGIGAISYFPGLYLWLIPGRYAGYFGGDFYSRGKWLLNPVFIMQLGILLFSFYFIKRNNKRFFESLETVQFIYLISTLLLILFGPLATVAGRISTIFATTEILLLPYTVFYCFKNKYLALFSYYVFCVCVFILIFVVSGAYTEYIPYRTIFF